MWFLYVNTIVIQSWEQVPSTEPCMGCSQLSTDSGWKLFLKCCYISGHFNGACRNCKWFNHAACCSVWDGGSGAFSSKSSSSLFSDNDDQEEGDQKPDDQLRLNDADQENEKDFRVWCEYFMWFLPSFLLKIYGFEKHTLWVFMMYNDQIVFLIVISQMFGVWCLIFDVQCFDV